jgi:Domain of unknown function (DUF4382)
LAKGKIHAALLILIVGGTIGYNFYRDYVQGTVTLSISDPPSGNGGNPHFNSTTLHIYVLFTGIDVHQTGIGSSNDTGWYPIVGSPTTVDMLSVLNTSKTLATVNLPTGTYDQIRFPVATATVTFSIVGNVAYNVPSGSINVSITGGGFQSSPGTKTQLLLTISFNDAEIMAMNGNLTPHATATIT